MTPNPMKAPCVKCGSRKKTVKYVGPYQFAAGCEVMPERLWLTCHTCGFSWPIAPLDASESTK